MIGLSITEGRLRYWLKRTEEYGDEKGRYTS